MRSATPTLPFLIAAGVSLYELARFIGTSVDQIDKTDGHLLPDSLDRRRSALDAFVLTSHGEPSRGRGAESADGGRLGTE